MMRDGKEESSTIEGLLEPWRAWRYTGYFYGDKKEVDQARIADYY